jgi:hypothetical protein
LVEENWGNEKTTNLLQLIAKHYHIMLHTSPWARLEPATLMMIGTDCIGRCKSNYHTFTSIYIQKKNNTVASCIDSFFHIPAVLTAMCTISWFALHETLFIDVNSILCLYRNGQVARTQTF